ncbi:MAG: ATP synthase F1 subunit delta [Gemmatimonadetes bacterium]|nr:ATP synthase F1 subunit delta [Gemmatimonadota bacterium]
MRDETVARNYAETLFELAMRNDALQEYGDAIETVAQLIEEDPRFRLFLETPRIDDDDKKQVVRRAFGDVLPRHVLNFVLVTIDKRRQRLLRSISGQYQGLLDAHMGREHVQVTVARPVDDATRQVITERLSAALGKEAIPHIRVQPEILGGLVIRTGDTIYDGSIRRRLDAMRRRLLQVELPAAVGDAAGA